MAGRKPKFSPAVKDEVERLVNLLAQCGCTVEEIASKISHTVIDPDTERLITVTDKTVAAHYSDAIKRGQEVGRSSLRGKQFEMAMKGNVAMLIWLGKQLLGQREKIDHEHVIDRELDALVTSLFAEGQSPSETAVAGAIEATSEPPQITG